MITLRDQLRQLVLSTIAPVLAVAVLLAVLLVVHAWERAKDDGFGRARSAMSAIDAEVRGIVSTVGALAASEKLASDDIAGFREEARRVLAAQPNWRSIRLFAPDRSQFFDAARSPDAPERRTVVDSPSFDRAIETRAVQFSDVVSAGGDDESSVRVRFPVVRGGAVRYVISVPIRTPAIEEILRAQSLPDGWVIALIDRQKRFIARNPPAAPGTTASDSFRRAVEQAPSGWFSGTTVEGWDSFTPYVTSSLTGWTLGIAIPAGTMWGPARTAAIGLALVTLLAIVAALALAKSISGRISRPIASLADEAARDAETAEGPSATPDSIEEIGKLRDALVAARRAARDRRTLLEREKLALEREQHALRDADRSKDEFLAMLSHELRNPLAAMMSAAHILKRVAPDHEAAARARDVIDRQTHQMSRLIDDLLDVSSVLMRKVHLVRERFDLGALVGASAAAWRAGGRFASHRLEVRVEEAWVDGDRSRIEQILVNLVDNAAKFTPPGNAIRIVVARVESEVMLAVADDGAGFRPEDSERIFGLFVQGSQGPERKAGGMGIGLALVKRLVELHGGTVTAESAGIGMGARFVVRVPAAKPAGREAATGTSPTASRRRSVLIVEDNDDQREMMRTAIGLRGHRVHVAPDATSALAIVDDDPPDIAFIDIGLPGIDGYELAGRLRERCGDRTTLVALTGYGQANDRRRAKAAGFAWHLTKPVDPAELEPLFAVDAQPAQRGCDAGIEAFETGSEPIDGRPAARAAAAGPQ